MCDQLPKYARRLDALHQALAGDFRNIVRKLGVQADQIVLDVGCGDGFFTRLLAENGRHVFGLDNSDAFLRYAERYER